MGLLHPEHRITSLKGQIKGSVLTPDDAGYDGARRAWNLLVDQHPAYILIAESADDVAAGVRFAHEAGLGVAVQSTGHGPKAPADGGLLIITSKMADVTVDPEARTARAEAGALWHHVVDAAVPHGLAPLLGSSPHVGVVGYTLGGGLGWLGRAFGLAADHVRALDVVTADGVLRHASPTENSDLLWGLRGGGGGFGVVTAIEFDLVQVATLYGGFMIYPGDVAAEALRFFRDWVKDAPDALTSSIAVLKFPSAPQLPEAIRGKVQVILRAAYAGDAAQGAALIQPWLDWRAPLENTFREMPFAEVGTISNDPVDPSPGYGSNMLLDTLSDAAIEVIVRRATTPESPLALNELRHGGGAISRASADANPIGNRDAQFYFQIGGPIFSPEMFAASRAAVQQYRAEMKPFLRDGAYLNFVFGSDAASRIREAYTPETLGRLAALKTKYDPDDVFRFSLHFGEPAAS